jgi:DUF4097 and DUF4098 domain-containing protein YvlB
MNLIKLPIGVVTLAWLMTVTQLARSAAPVVIDEILQVSANQSIEIEVMRGDVVIRTGADNSFRVSGTLDELAEGFELRSDNGFTYFEVLMPRNINGNRFRRAEESDLEIVVPVGSRVSFVGVNVDVDIAGVEGGSEVNTVNGNITAGNLSERVDLRTVNGNIDSTDNSGRIDLQTVNGDIRDTGSEGRAYYEAVNGGLNITSAAEEVEVTVVNGSVDAQLQRTRELTLRSVNGNIEVTLTDVTSPRIAGSTVSGEIILTLPGDVDARFSLESHAGGNIINNITGDEVARARFGPARSLDFSTGQGVGVIEMRSVSGRLELHAN